MDGRVAAEEEGERLDEGEDGPRIGELGEEKEVVRVVVSGRRLSSCMGRKAFTNDGWAEGEVGTDALFLLLSFTVSQ